MDWSGHILVTVMSGFSRTIGISINCSRKWMTTEAWLDFKNLDQYPVLFMH
ncbi:uncharacterized protein METZ01_LOCUS405166 [marine metagenome]|uniref:Uncharacterized protein n=1 Tax=marine metagenome TaxID=408172 RepID=A0A382W0J5_9ZZZZ